ncbi:type II toxin-antitoxin system VapC family toxin [Saccharolobus sp. A20]|uniref:type II toxin-antitoxin system VapC family toxin n=2 Tax=Sulfolobaceae TaxID=118883 RepID=UPI001E300D8E|nr:type II toxin-antitoxin system VapC family toxin [Sulfolobus sp. A20]
MSKYLFDASSIINLMKRGTVTLLADGETLDLALYEAINAIWKEYSKLKVISKDLSKRYIRVVRRVMEVIPINIIKGLEEEVFDLASKEDLTIYDASYLLIAKRKNLVLVTDDNVLRSKPVVSSFSERIKFIQLHTNIFYIMQDVGMYPERLA